MAENTTEQEPSIEEILASIRQIISDDDGAPAPEPKKAEPPKPEPVPEPMAEPVKEDVFELTERLDDQPEEAVVIDMQDSEVEEAPELPPPPPPKPVAPPSAPKMEEDSIFTQTAAAAALQGFSKLTSNVAIEKSSHAPGISLEDIVREMLRPMLKDWIDANLPNMIEKLVEKELDKLARKALD